MGDAFAGDVEAFAEGGVVGVDFFAVIGEAEEGVAAVAFEEVVFPLDDHAEVLVVEDDDFGVDFFDACGGEFLDVHEEAAVAVDVDDLAVWAGDFGAECGGVAEAHGAEACGGDEGAGVDVGVVLASPHLVLADACGDDGFAVGEFAEGLDDELWGDAVGVFFVGEGVGAAPGVDLVEPGLEGFAGSVFGLDDLVEAGEGVADVAEDGEVDGFVFVEFGGVDVDVDDGAVFAEFGDFAGDAVVEADADGEEEVGFVDGVVGVDGAVHAEPFEGEGVVLGKAPQPMMVVATGMPVCWTKVRSSWEALALMTPPPT